MLHLVCLATRAMPFSFSACSLLTDNGSPNRARYVNTQLGSNTTLSCPTGLSGCTYKWKKQNVQIYQSNADALVFKTYSSNSSDRFTCHVTCLGPQNDCTETRSFDVSFYTTWGKAKLKTNVDTKVSHRRSLLQLHINFIK